MHDAEAIRRLKHGDIRGLETLVVRYQVKALRATFMVVQDEALSQDVVQDTFVRLFQRIRSFDESRPFEPYLMRSVVNAALNAVNKAKREAYSDGENDEVGRLLDRAASVEAQAEINELQERILHAITALTPGRIEVQIIRSVLWGPWQVTWNPRKHPRAAQTVVPGASHGPAKSTVKKSW
jgi:RNA polymerase sigma-70 factor (ECF subfamily)